MRHRGFILLATLLALVIFGGVGVYAVDASQDGKIADGVTVAGIDVGGLEAGEARKAIAEQVQAPLEQPVTVKYAGKEYELSPEDAKVKADVNGMIDEALEESRDGSIITRTTRAITGGDVKAEIDLQVTYDQDAVDKLVKKVEKKVKREPRNAKVEFAGDHVQKVKGQMGVELNSDVLRERLRDELVHPSPERVVKATVTKTKPKVGIDDLADEYPTLLSVSRSKFELRLYKNLKLKKTYPIAVGQVGLDTPAGLYKIQNKAVNPAWSVPNSAWAGDLAGTVVPGGIPSNPLKARWLGIYNGAGIHGTSDVGSLGSAASHGCVRMAVPDVIELYDQVPVGAQVYIS
jgi:lipoprotein-anchoring transpeptidase ErfK/SrfK